MEIKLEKITKEIKKISEQISKKQDKLKELKEQQKLIEDQIMIDEIRKNKINHIELKSILDIYRDEKEIETRE